MIDSKLLKKNKFYKLKYSLYDIDNEWLFQFKGWDLNFILTNNYIIRNGIFHSDYLLKTAIDDIIEEISFVDIIQYLPDGNLDKITYLRKNKIKYLINL